MTLKHHRRGFTFIELIFVIVISGIVGGLALEAIRQYYEGIYRMKELTKRGLEADHILEQVSVYFENAISSSIVNLDRQGVANDCYGTPSAGDLNDYTVAFVGVDSDSLRGIDGSRPGWSEDTALGAGNVITAADANHTMTNNVITAFGSTLNNSAIYDNDSVDVNACIRFGFLNGGAIGSAGYHRIAGSTLTTLTLNPENNATNGKRKYLLRTGYAFRVQNDGNFTMYSNFRPWLNERYDTATNINNLGQNVAHFYADFDASDFQNNPDVNDRGLVWRLKVCMRGIDDNLSMSDSENQGICRERRVHVRY